MLKFGLGTKVPKLFVNSSLFCTFQSQLKRWFYSRCQMHVFLQFSQKTLVCISRVFETKYQPLSGPCSHRTPCQVLIFSSYPHYFLLVFWELMLGYVTFLCWYPNFCISLPISACRRVNEIRDICSMRKFIIEFNMRITHAVYV
jgi:hypothetical protein